MNLAHKRKKWHKNKKLLENKKNSMKDISSNYKSYKDSCLENL